MFHETTRDPSLVSLFFDCPTTHSTYTKDRVSREAHEVFPYVLK